MSFTNIKEIRKFNQIVRMWEKPCIIGFELWIETLLPALIPVLISFVTPGGVEVIEIWLGRYHGLGGKALRRGAAKVFPNFVDTSNKIFLWKILAPIERTLFWWMVVDLVEDFFFNWESMTLKAAGCTPDQRVVTASSDEAVANDVPNQPYLWHVDSGDPLLCTIDGFIVPPYHTGNIGFAISSKPILGVCGDLDVSVVDGFTGELVHQLPILTQQESANGKSSAWWATVHGGATGRWLKAKVNSFHLPCATEGHGGVQCAPLP